jgi:uncharacterized protein (TIGR00369 family)
MNPDLLTLGRRVLSQQPFSVLLGATLENFVEGHAEISLPVKPDLLQQHGFVHGGVLAYLADNTLTYAGGSLLGDCVTAEFKINYLRPAVACDRLLAVATTIGSGKTQVVCRCESYLIQGQERKLCAAAQGTIRKAG